MNASPMDSMSKELEPGERRIAWFNCQAGVAGDMAMAALVDAGADTDTVASIIGGLGVDGYALLFERVQRCGVAATWANVVVHHEHDDHEPDSEVDHESHRPVRKILELLDGADLPERVRRRARAVFERLGEVEGAIHGVDPADVELHEVGALDSIVDLQTIRGLEPTGTSSDEPLYRPNLRLHEAVISARSELAGRTIKQAKIRTRFGAAVIAVRRQGQELRGKIGDIELRPGDTLLLEAPKGAAERFADSDNFYLISEREGSFFK